MSGEFKTHFVTLPPLDAKVEEKLAGHNYFYKIESVDVEIGSKVEKDERVLGRFGVYVDRLKQNYWTGDLTSRKAGKVKKINIFEGSKVTPGEALLEIEYCPHEIEYGGLCVSCGEDITHLSNENDMGSKKKKDEDSRYTANVVISGHRARLNSKSSPLKVSNSLGNKRPRNNSNHSRMKPDIHSNYNSNNSNNSNNNNFDASDRMPGFSSEPDYNLGGSESNHNYIEYGTKKLRLTKNAIARTKEENATRLLKQRKLVLVLDIDHTFLHATRDAQAYQVEQHRKFRDSSHSFRIDNNVNGKSNYFVKIRPGFRKFLSDICDYFEIHLYTMSVRKYAEEIVKWIENEEVKPLIKNLVTRDDVPSSKKLLHRLLPCDERMVIIVDDRIDVWPNVSSNVIKIHKYTFWPSEEGHIHGPRSDMNNINNKNSSNASGVLRQLGHCVVKLAHGIPKEYSADQRKSLQDEFLRWIVGYFRNYKVEKVHIRTSHEVMVWTARSPHPKALERENFNKGINYAVCEAKVLNDIFLGCTIEYVVNFKELERREGDEVLPCLSRVLINIYKEYYGLVDEWKHYEARREEIIQEKYVKRKHQAIMNLMKIEYLKLLKLNEKDEMILKQCKEQNKKLNDMSPQFIKKIGEMDKISKMDSIKDKESLLEMAAKCDVNLSELAINVDTVKNTILEEKEEFLKQLKRFARITDITLDDVENVVKMLEKKEKLLIAKNESKASKDVKNDSNDSKDSKIDSKGSNESSDEMDENDNDCDSVSGLSNLSESLSPGPPQAPQRPDARKLLKQCKKQVFAGFTFVFTGLWQRDKNPRDQVIYKLSIEFGAKVSNKLSVDNKEGVTHCIGPRMGTEKMNNALQNGIECVHHNWVFNSTAHYMQSNPSIYRPQMWSDEKHGKKYKMNKHKVKKFLNDKKNGIGSNFNNFNNNNSNSSSSSSASARINGANGTNGAKGMNGKSGASVLGKRGFGAEGDDMQNDGNDRKRRKKNGKKSKSVRFGENSIIHFEKDAEIDNIEIDEEEMERKFVHQIESNANQSESERFGIRSNLTDDAKPKKSSKELIRLMKSMKKDDTSDDKNDSTKASTNGDTSVVSNEMNDTNDANGSNGANASNGSEGETSNGNDANGLNFLSLYGNDTANAEEEWQPLQLSASHIAAEACDDGNDADEPNLGGPLQPMPLMAANESDMTRKRIEEENMKLGEVEKDTNVGSEWSNEMEDANETDEVEDIDLEEENELNEDDFENVLLELDQDCDSFGIL